MRDGFFKAVFDSDTTLHKLASYGVATLCVIWAVFMSSGKEALDPSVGTVIIAFILYYTILTKRVLETLLWATVLGMAIVHGTGFIQGFQEGLLATMANGDFAWIVLMCCFLNVFNQLLSKTGSLRAFSGLVKARVTKPQHLNIATWLMQFPLFFDDYMTVTVGGSIMAPMYDRMKVPREEGAYLIHTLAEPLRVLFPLTSWAAFMGGLFAAAGYAGESGRGMGAFIASIPFNFYAIVSIIGTALFAWGRLPKWGAMRHPKPEEYETLEEEGAEEEDSTKKAGNLYDFFLPIVGMLVVAYFFDFNIVPAMPIVLVLTAAYYLVRGIISSNDIEECLVNGFSNFMALIILFCVTYMLNDVLAEMGYVDYLAGTVQSLVNPHFLPVIVFVVFCLSECIMSLNWGLLLIAFPMLLPVATAIGANPILTGAAIISAGCFGCNMCFICDYTMLTSSVFGIKPGQHASTCVPYSIAFAVVSALCFLVAGFIV